MNAQLLAQLSQLFICEHHAQLQRNSDPSSVARLGTIAVELEARARQCGWRGDPRDAFDQECSVP